MKENKKEHVLRYIDNVNAANNKTAKKELLKGLLIRLFSDDANASDAFSYSTSGVSVTTITKQLLTPSNKTNQYLKPSNKENQKLVALNKTKELLIAPDGRVYRCHSDLFAEENSIGNITDPEFQIEDKFRPCDKYGKCHPCDVKMKTNYKQELGHTSVEIKDIQD